MVSQLLRDPRLSPSDITLLEEYLKSAKDELNHWDKEKERDMIELQEQEIDQMKNTH